MSRGWCEAQECGRCGAEIAEPHVAMSLLVRDDPPFVGKPGRVMLCQKCFLGLAAYMKGPGRWDPPRGVEPSAN